MQFSISHTVSVFTVYHLPEFLEWCSRLGLPKPYLGLVTNPKIYNITVLPKQAKDKITQRLSGIPELEPVVNAMWAHDDSHELDNLIKAVKILDVQRNQSFPDTNFELFNLLGEKCQTLYQLY
jgi:hypothetical protein